MSRLLLLIALLVSACGPRFAPTDSAHVELASLAGDWSGTLTYTDYGDDASRTALPITVSASTVQDPTFDAAALLLEIAYREPDGSPAGSSRALFTPLPSEPDAVGYDLERWTLLDQSSNGTGFSYTFEREGEDNNQSAMIRHTVAFDGTTLSDRKEVRYAGSDTFIERNIAELTR